MIDPAIQKLLDTVFRAPATPAAAPDVAQMRAWALESQRLLGGAPEPVAQVQDASARGAHGAIRLRVYRAVADAPTSIALYAHGGGWVTGSLDSHDTLCRALANRLQATLVAVDYRLAPERPYPAALDDFDAAWGWVHAHAEELGGEGAPRTVGGDSSGGNLAAALTLRLRARGEPQPAAQLLLYPVLDADCSGPSYTEFSAGFNLTATQMAWYWAQYAGAASHADAQLAPLAAPDHRALAPAVIAVAENDVLRDDGAAYARRLGDAGVPVRFIECAGTIHGFLRWAGAVPASLAWLDTIAEAQRAMLV